ncbi:hypothetical protein GCK72_022676 [Caenorhabditis remanei]|uniref:RRM domain-containing protein n=1 Tax=Caenorhabditis remanei TaxID=31234 RepID=A0A6A5FUK6_CAERE|nr:hypothetical protein GCK72_022676 [Caenorhabditis remanei]KAF1746223.1 hypothetical protein GCK72_022676 [Caenorhabditis remanei]
MSDMTVYVGNLPSDVREKEIEDIFHKYGEIRNIDIKSRSRDSPAFAFIQFDDRRDAKEAVRARDGYEFDGKRLRVEFPRGQGPRGPGGRPTRDNGSRFGRNGGPPKRSNYRLIVEGLPRSGSWQDIKDHLKQAGEICYANVHNGEGVVEFERYEDLEYAIRKYDDTKFRSHKGETAYIRLKEDKSEYAKENKRRTRSISRSKSPNRGRCSRSSSRSKSSIRGRRTGSASKSRSRSPVSRQHRDRSESGSPARRVSRSRSPIFRQRPARSESGTPARRATRSRSPVKRQSHDRSVSSVCRASRSRSPPSRDASVAPSRDVSPDQSRRSSQDGSPRDD